jgi:hypothetical protein
MTKKKKTTYYFGSLQMKPEILTDGSDLLDCLKELDLCGPFLSKEQCFSVMQDHLFNQINDEKLDDNRLNKFQIFIHKADIEICSSYVSRFEMQKIDGIDEPCSMIQKPVKSNANILRGF